MWTYPFRLLDGIRHWARLRRLPTAHAMGKRGEDLAHRYLQKKGLMVVKRNWRRPGGKEEVDIVAWNGENLILVEVKTRSNLNFAAPERAIDASKIRAIKRAGGSLRRLFGVSSDVVRYDLVTVVLSPLEINHFEAVWSSEGGDRLSW